jgi:hypothetical protein
MKLLAGVAFALGLAIGQAQAQTAFTIPSFTLHSAASTGVNCAPTSAASGLASAAPAGTVIFNCTVTPSGWTGTVTCNDSALQIVGQAGNLFNLSLVAAGVVQTYPAGTGTATP